MAKAKQFVCICAVMALAFVATFASASVCNIMFLTDLNAWDHEQRMGADIMVSALDLHADTDYRVVYGGSALTGGELTQTATAVAEKIAACHTAGRKILIDWHSAQSTRSIIKKMGPLLWQTLRRAAAGGDANHLRGVHAVPRPVINMFSCSPFDFGDYDFMRDSVNSINVANWGGVAGSGAAATAARRDELGQWLFGARGSAANMALLRAVIDRRAALTPLQHQFDTAATVVQKAALTPGLHAAQRALSAAQLAADAVPAAQSIYAYAVGQQSGWIVDSLIVANHGAGPSGKVLAHAPFADGDRDGTQIAHYHAKQACYHAYPLNAADLTSAIATSTCILRAVFAVSPHAGDRGTYGAPVLAHGHRNDANMGHRPLLMDIDTAFPDLAGHLRAIPNVNPPAIGHQNAHAAVYVKGAHIPAINPMHVTAWPHNFLQTKARVHAVVADADKDEDADADEFEADENAEDAEEDEDAEEEDTEDAAEEEEADELDA